MHSALFLRLLPLRDIPHKRAECIGPSLPQGRRDRQFYRNLVSVSVMTCDFAPGVQHRPFAGCKEVPQSPFMGFPLLWRNDGGGKGSPDGLWPGPAEYLFCLDIPVGDDSGCIHPDEAIERHLDDTPRVCLALPQRPFSLPGKRTLVL